MLLLVRFKPSIINPHAFFFFFLSCDFRYYNLDAYYQHKMLKDMKKGHKKLSAGERTVFDDEEQRRYFYFSSYLPAVHFED